MYVYITKKTRAADIQRTYGTHRHISPTTHVPVPVCTYGTGTGTGYHRVPVVVHIRHTSRSLWAMGYWYDTLYFATNSTM